MIDPAPTRARFACLSPHLDERARRLLVVSEVKVVGALLRADGFSLQANSKTLEGSSHPDRDAQVTHIGQSMSAALVQGQPVISVDAKNNESVGPFKTPGQAWRPQGDPEQVRVRDLLIEELGRAVPYGVYGLAASTGWVSVAVDGDVAALNITCDRSFHGEWNCVIQPHNLKNDAVVL